MTYHTRFTLAQNLEIWLLRSGLMTVETLSQGDAFELCDTEGQNVEFVQKGVEV
jgi:hypothetical protein